MDIYRERAHMVAFLTSLFPASKWVDERYPEYVVIGVETLAGQLSWHVHPDDMDLFQHVTEEGVWDGHTTEVKYERLTRVGQDFSNLMAAFMPAIGKILDGPEVKGA